MTTSLLKTEIGDAIHDIEMWKHFTFTVYVEKLSLWDRVLLFFDKCLKRK
jgi:hypothetical protein